MSLAQGSPGGPSGGPLERWGGTMTLRRGYAYLLPSDQPSKTRLVTVAISSAPILRASLQKFQRGTVILTVWLAGCLAGWPGWMEAVR